MYIKLFEDNPNTRDILKVVEVLKAGGIIIYPTDTIYAIGCDINNVKAVQRVCQLKNIKPEKANFSMICRDLSNIAAYAKVNNEVFKVMKRNLPGPFTFVLPATNKLPNVMINRRKTIGIRIPDNYIVMSIVEELGNPLLTTSVKAEDEVVEYMTLNGVSPMADLRKKNGHEEPWTIDYFGVGNENWGCGGNMRPQYYADEYRRYQTYVRNYDPQKPIQKICGGANVDDYDWTRKVLETTHDHTVPEFHGFMDGLSLHYYVHPEGWEIKGSATDFDEEVWYKTLKKALYMETLVERHGKIMDQYDPDKKIGMIVDEWGCWFTVEPGTNPGFLYQQNTVRDALVAGITLNIFNKHCDRVKMANLAQMVNVLQSVILTEGPKMIKTPTYHVFHMYRHHQGATLLNSTLTGVGETGIGEWKVPEVTESVSEDAEHIITVTLNNLSADEEKEIEIVIAGDEHVYSVKEAKVVSAEMHAHNTFDAPELVKEEVFTAYKKCADGIKIMLPPCSVVELRLQ